LRDFEKKAKLQKSKVVVERRGSSAKAKYSIRIEPVSSTLNNHLDSSDEEERDLIKAANAHHNRSVQSSHSRRLGVSPKGVLGGKVFNIMGTESTIPHGLHNDNGVSISYTG